MKNKWSLFQDSEIWQISFNSENIPSYPELLVDFVLVCYTSNLLKLNNKDSNGEESFSTTLDTFIKYLERLKTENGKNLYPKVSSSGIFNFGKTSSNNFFFDNSLYLFDKSGNIDHVTINYDNIQNVLHNIGHGQANYTGLSLPFEFDTYYGMGKDRKVKSYNFIIQFNSDIWLPKVPCIHCPRSISNEILRKGDGLKSVLDHWHDNSILCELNRVKLNLFLKKIKKICVKYDGQINVEPENLKLYLGKFDSYGFVSEIA